MKVLWLYANCLFLSLLLIGFSFKDAQAHWGKVQVTDGQGDNLEIHQYPLGLGKGVQVQDKLGDSFGYKKGLFGINRDTNAAILGNDLKIHHGLLGTSVDGQSMFGDTVKSHKFLKVGPRITTVNLQGMSGLASGLLHPSAPANINPSQTNPYSFNPSSFNQASFNQASFNQAGFNQGANGNTRSYLSQPGEAMVRPENYPMRGNVDPNAYASQPQSP
jgi:hypothetical protein